MLPLLFWMHPFLSKVYILCSSAYKRYGFVTDNQPVIVMLPKQYKSKEGVKISTIVLTQKIVLVSELTHWMHFVKFSHLESVHSYAKVYSQSIHYIVILWHLSLLWFTWFPWFIFHSCKTFLRAVCTPELCFALNSIFWEFLQLTPQNKTINSLFTLVWSGHQPQKQQ